MRLNQELRWWEEKVHNLSLDNLLAETCHYWDLGGSQEDRLKQYVDYLLPFELAYAAQRGALAPLRCHTLVLLVGYSIEPLFQAICVFEPLHVILLLNKTYGCRGIEGVEWESGEQYGRKVKDWIEKSLCPVLGDRQPQSIESHTISSETDSEAALPDAVFRALCQHVLAIRGKLQSLEKDWDLDVLIDITGAKKSMDVGAFLFASYASIDVTYVDFDCYHREKRRPYGFSCRIGRLHNPYETFALHQWETVQHAYEGYHFRAAREAIQDTLRAMRRPPMAGGAALFTPQQIAATRRLRQVLRFYEAWDNADYQRAHRLLPWMKPPFLAGEFAAPTVVNVLANFWARLTRVDTVASPCQPDTPLSGRTGSDWDLMLSNPLLLIYARDEMAKIERLVQYNEDNRSALLRAVGLDELLLKARLVRLWHNNQLHLCDQDDQALGLCQSLEEHLKSVLLKLLIEHSGPTYHWRGTLRGTAHVPLRVTAKEDKDYLRRHVSSVDRVREYRVYLGPNAPAMRNYENDCNPPPRVLTELRNQAIHKYQSISHSVAQAAIKLARANLEDFEDKDEKWLDLGNGIKPPQSMVERVPWDQVRVLCRLDFLPLFPQRKEIET